MTAILEPPNGPLSAALEMHPGPPDTTHPGPAKTTTPPGPPVETRPGGRPGTALILTGVILTAANLRLGVSATGALLTQLHTELHLSNTATSVLPSIWVVAFAFGGFSGATLARRFGPDRVVGAALAALIAGTLLRGVASAPALLAGSIIAGLGIALGNVLLPVVCREYFPHRMGLVTGLYGTALSAGSALSALASIPAANALGGASRGLAIWAAPAALALVGWIAAGRQRARFRGHGVPAAPTTAPGAKIPAAEFPAAETSAAEASAAKTSAAKTSAAQFPASEIPAAPPARAHIPLRALTRSRLAWAMAALFGLQSASAYVIMGYLPSIFEASGMSADRAGALLSATFFLGLPASFAAPVLAARMADQRVLLGSLSLAMVVGFLGLALDPTALAWLWIVVLAVGMSAFQVVLTLFGLRGGTPAATAALSTFGQSLGYLAAGAVPFGAGLLWHATGSWTAPLLGMAGIAVLQCFAGLYVASGRRGTLGSGGNSASGGKPASGGDLGARSRADLGKADTRC